MRRIFELYCTHSSIRAVVQLLDADGVRTCKDYRFGPRSIAPMLKNRF